MTKEGFKFIIPTLAISLILFAVWAYSSEVIILPFAAVFFLLSFFFLFFFRDPERKAPNGENLILSSADGKVILIKPFENLKFVGEKGTLVSVFMSVFDVHVNRAPISGKVKYFKYNPGKFHPAFKDKASLENEQTELGLENERGRIILKQIAGIIARRIVCKVKSRDSVKIGERFGMIKFGSRVDLFLPENVEIKVKLNQRVKAGETIIGIFKK
ncbi:MAG: phosphatidylserine decarboxylase family protein [candidate division Zixibacteria bacterium]|nr:phosphatidylserine decarboxylase family protein [candidate division Zixibacteria bacterium]